MARSRFYFPDKLAPGSEVQLTDNAAHHASKVLRMKEGDTLILFNGDGQDYLGSILRINKSEVAVKIIGIQQINNESPLDITLAQAISSGERMDFTLQKAVELGIRRIQPLAAERSVVKLHGERADKRTRHWQNVVIAACEQSGRATVPEVAPPMPLLDWLSQDISFELKLMLHPDSPQRLRDHARPEGKLCLLIGCEGGFSPTEIAAAQHAGFVTATLGPRVLRTETAALTALAALQTLWGDY